MIQKIKQFIEENNMIDKGDHIILGVSGGADSVCLLHVFFSFKKIFPRTRTHIKEIIEITIKE